MKSQRSLEVIFKEIGALDHKKKALMTELKRTPAYAIKYIEDAIKGKLGAGIGWYVRNDHQGVPMPVDNKTKVIRYTAAKVEAQKSNVVKINQNMYSVIMTVENLEGTVYTSQMMVSIDRPITPQIWSSMTELDATKIRKIEAELKKIEEKKKTAAKIKELEDTIAKASAELQKLKK